MGSAFPLSAFWWGCGGGRRDKEVVCLEDALCLVMLRRAGREAHYWLEALFMTLHKSLTFTINSAVPRWLSSNSSSPPSCPTPPARKEEGLQGNIPEGIILQELQGSPPPFSPPSPSFTVSNTQTHAIHVLNKLMHCGKYKKADQRTSRGRLRRACDARESASVSCSRQRLEV